MKLAPISQNSQGIIKMQYVVKQTTICVLKHTQWNLLMVSNLYNTFKKLFYWRILQTSCFFFFFLQYMPCDIDYLVCPRLLFLVQPIIIETDIPSCHDNKLLCIISLGLPLPSMICPKNVHCLPGAGNKFSLGVCEYSFLVDI